MASRAIRFVPDKGWRRFEKAIQGSNAAKKVNKHMALATRRNGLLAVRMIRKTIKRGNFEANAPLTVEIKKSSKPLVDKGQLWQSITSQQVSGRTVFAGVLFTDDNYNIAAALHDGVAIKVTPKMRNMFRALWWASIGTIDPGELRGSAALLWERKPGGWLPLRESTNAIIIPARRFIEEAFKSPELRRQAIENWQKALASAFRELSKGA